MQGWIKMQVKICGITNAEDLKTCENESTAFIGFINVKRSWRFIDTNKISELKGKMKNPEKAVLVLEPESADEIINKSEKCGIKNVQLHSLSAREIAEIKDVNVIRAIGIPENMNKEKMIEIENFARVCDYLLFDSQVRGQSGGTGKQIPLEIAEKAVETAKNINPEIKLFLAGGMNTERMKNEGKKIKNLFDYVDVNSGVEESPGIKNEYKIIEFMETCSQVNL
jgi:phosphoribosylanthranilate isomerase